MKEKLGFRPHDVKQRRAVVHNYVAGLQWVLSYYYEGVISWGWFYPHHYAPMITDMVNLEQLEIKFEKGKPFKPYEQLLGVLPAASASLVPFAFQELMKDSASPIADFYPDDFETDLNGKKQDWEAIVKIPFIDEERLLIAMQRFNSFLIVAKYALLSPSEVARNNLGKVWSFHYSKNPIHVTSSLPGKFPGIN